MLTRQNGATIRQLRQERGLGLRELATLVRITPRGLSNVECENTNASKPLLYRLAAQLTATGEAVSYEQLLAVDEPAAARVA